MQNFTPLDVSSPTPPPKSAKKSLSSRTKLALASGIILFVGIISGYSLISNGVIFNNQATYTQVRGEPGMPSCPANHTKVAEFGGGDFALINSSKLTFDQTFNSSADVKDGKLLVYQGEGHNWDYGCKVGAKNDNGMFPCDQAQPKEIAKFEINNAEVGRFTDHSPDDDNHFLYTFNINNLKKGSNSLHVQHTQESSGPDSVFIKGIICAQNQAPTATPTKAPTATPTPGTSASCPAGTEPMFTKSGSISNGYTVAKGGVVSGLEGSWQLESRSNTIYAADGDKMTVTFPSDIIIDTVLMYDNDPKSGETGWSINGTKLPVTGSNNFSSHKMNLTTKTLVFDNGDDSPHYNVCLKGSTVITPTNTPTATPTKTPTPTVCPKPEAVKNIKVTCPTCQGL